MDVGGRPKTGVSDTPVFEKPITLAEAGIDKNLAKRARSEAASEEEFQHYLAKAKQKLRDAIEGNRTNLTGQTGGNEWVTPAEYIALARRVLGESTSIRPLTGQPKKLPERKTFSRSKMTAWGKNGTAGCGSTHHMPSRRSAISSISSFQMSPRKSTAAILLTNNCTDTSWFHKVAEYSAVFCLTRGRIRFVALDGTIGSPTQGQAFFYFGNESERFGSVFSEVGLIGGFQAAP